MSVEQLELRLAALERRCQHQRRWFVVLLGAFVLCIGGGAFQLTDMPEVVRARRFELVNDDGAVIWTAASTAEGNGITQISNSKGQVVWVAVATANGTGSTAVFNTEAKSVWAAGVNNGHGLTQVSHSSGIVRWWAAIDEKGNGLTKVWDNDANVAWSSEQPD